MVNRSEAVYFSDENGNRFSYFEHYSPEHISAWLAEGTVIEARMPAPTKKRPERYITVYHWKGIRTSVWAAAFERRDLSAQMPPIVTELAAAGNRMHKAFAFSYRGIMMGNSSRPVMVPA